MSLPHSIPEEVLPLVPRRFHLLAEAMRLRLLDSACPRAARSGHPHGLASNFEDVHRFMDFAAEFIDLAATARRPPRAHRPLTAIRLDH